MTAILPQAPDRIITQKLMPVSVGLDDHGQPAPALRKKLAALGMENIRVSELKQAREGKSDMLFLEQSVSGVLLTAGLQQAMDGASRQLPVAKVMTYQLGDGWQNVNFVRPVHGLVALYGEQVLPVQLLGLTAGNKTRGHRFEAKQDPLVIGHAD